MTVIKEEIMAEQASIDKKKKISFAFKALIAVILLLIIYTVYHVCVGLEERVKTTPAGLVEQSESIILEGVIFRVEEGIVTANKGDVRPYYYDGERVSVDSAVAAVYTKGGNADANERIAALEEKLDILKRSNVKGLVSIVDIERTKKDIETLYTSVMRALSDNDMLRAHRLEKELTVAMNKLAIYEGRVKNYNTEIAEIESELDTLYNSFKGDKEYVFADKGGYFYHSCDGYEDTLNADKLSSLTPSELEGLVETVKATPKAKSNYTVKFVYTNVWSIAVPCDLALAESLEEGKQYSTLFFDTRERELTLTLESIGKKDESSAVLVFTCEDMPEGFDYTRYQQFRLDVSSVEGYRVPKEVLQWVTDSETGEEICGVYVLNASVVSFKRVEIIGESEGYYIASKLDKSKEDYREYLDLNDLIILDTKGMYDGKILKR